MMGGVLNIQVRAFFYQQHLITGEKALGYGLVKIKTIGEMNEKEVLAVSKSA